VTTEGANQVVTGTATDRAGNSASVSVTLNIDKSVPMLTLSPMDGSSVNEERPLFTASYTDGLSGLNISSLRIFLDGQEVTASFSKQANQATFTPSQNLASGGHSWNAEIADMAGNNRTATAAFTIVSSVDTTGPSVQLTPGNGTIVNTQTPQLVASYSDNGSGVNLDSVIVVLDGITITNSCIKLPQGISFTPNSPLLDGNHTWKVTVSDLTGNMTIAQTTFIVSTDPSETVLRGKVMDLQGNPLSGLPVQLETEMVWTQSDGSFEIATPPGRYRFRVDGLNRGFGVFGMWMDIQPGINMLPQDVYLPLVPLDEKGTQVDPERSTILTSPDLPGLVVEILPHSLYKPDGTFYTGKLMLVNIPLDRVVIPLPEGIVPNLVFNIQPAGMRYSPPPVITMPNTFGAPEGAVLDIWRLSITKPGFDRIG
jgi:hypothetical protein